MKDPIKDFFSNQKVIIIDGAMATELERKGCDLKDRLWSAKVLSEKPERIKEVHLDYFIAGADIAITASYQATIQGFIGKGFSEEEAVRLIASSVMIAREARDEFWAACDQTNRMMPLVAASIGPYGAYLADGSEYVGNYNRKIPYLKEFHRERMNILIRAGADLLACETLPCLDEAIALTDLLNEHRNIGAWISFSCKNATQISDGTDIFECAKWLDDKEQVLAIGINCTAPEYVESLIKEVRRGTNKPIIVYPNSGEKYDPVSKNWEPIFKGIDYLDWSKKWYESGASLIGGCCRTQPSDIEKISNWFRKERDR